MDLFDAFPALRRYPLLSGKKVALVGISTIAYTDSAYYFEVGKPKYWQQYKSDATTTTIVGVGGIGGTIKQGESVMACLRREAEEELGVRVRLVLSRQTYLIHDWQIVDTLNLPPSKKRPTPLMVILVPPRLGGPGIPDHLAIVAFHTRLRGMPVPRDLFGLLRVESRALADFFSRDEWPLDEAQAHPGLTIVLNDQLPPGSVLRPVLTARAFQLLIRAGCDMWS
ncbi:MAG: NUDIX hydrolase [Chloroflexota bacterium]|nr:NUDIX hydrolase [Chloroflexota bacterium]